MDLVADAPMRRYGRLEKVKVAHIRLPELIPVLGSQLRG